MLNNGSILMRGNAAKKFSLSAEIIRQWTNKFFQE